MRGSKNSNVGNQKKVKLKIQTKHEYKSRAVRFFFVKLFSLVYPQFETSIAGAPCSTSENFFSALENPFCAFDSFS